MLATLWLRSRRRLRLVRAEVAATRSGRPPRTLIPGPREVVKGVSGEYVVTAVDWAA